MAERHSWVPVAVLLLVVIFAASFAFRIRRYPCGHMSVEAPWSLRHYCHLIRPMNCLRMIKTAQDVYKQNFGRYAPDLDALQTVGLAADSVDVGKAFTLRTEFAGDTWSATAESGEYPEKVSGSPNGVCVLRP